MSDPDDPRAPLLAAKRAVPATLSERHSSSTSAPLSPDLKDNLETSKTDSDEMDNLSKKSQWIVLALASGACAAFNGVFAKLYVMFSVLRHVCFLSTLLSAHVFTMGLRDIMRYSEHV